MKHLRAFFLLGIFLLPLSASAATSSSFEVSGWIPYWRTATGTADVLPHLNELTEVNPFVYTLKNDGTLFDNGSLDTEPWLSFIAAAKAQHVRVIPTVMSPGGASLDAILSNATKRVALETSIANLVNQKGYDGIDIDFEGKLASDKDYFSTFLKGLYERMGTKWVMCDIEARTPTDSRYYGTTIPPDASIYANDFTQINKYCDRVRIMAYDQQGVDLKLAAQAASSSQIYAPISDPAWVTKVVQLAEQSISPNKIEIGIPTYGYEYDVTAYASDQYDYNILWTFNPGYATQIESQYNVAPIRAPWGEEELTYLSTTASTTPPISSLVTTPLISGLATAAAASTFATNNNSHLDFRLLVWPDAQAIASKIALAKSLGVRGVSIFKLDGGEDPGIWSVLAGVAGSSSTAGSATQTSSSSASAALSRDLDIGVSGTDVRILQRILNSDPATKVATSGVGSPGNESTYFGVATQLAVEKFQVKYGIAAAGNSGYGRVGPATRAKLNALLASL